MRPRSRPIVAPRRLIAGALPLAAGAVGPATSLLAAVAVLVQAW